MRNVIFIAPPAAGKGTLSDYLVENKGYAHLSTGDILRRVSREDTEQGIRIRELLRSGTFIGDDIVLPLFREELLKIKDKPFVLDGMPRNLEQAHYLETLFSELSLENYVVIHIDVAKELLEKRVVGRRVCETCKSSYNIYFPLFAPHEEALCDKCHTKLIQRSDDSLETFQERFKTYEEVTQPLIHFYETKGKLKILDGSMRPEDLINAMHSILEEDTND